MLRYAQQVLWGSQEKVTRHLMGKLPRQRGDGKWKHTSAESARVEVGMETMNKYIRRSHNTVTHDIYNKLLLYLCEATEWNQGAQVRMWWWGQAVTNLAGDRETEEMAEEAETDRMEE